MAMGAGETFPRPGGVDIQTQVAAWKSCPRFFFTPNLSVSPPRLSQHVKRLPCRNPNTLKDHEFQSICLD